MEPLICRDKQEPGKTKEMLGGKGRRRRDDPRKKGSTACSRVQCALTEICMEQQRNSSALGASMHFPGQLRIRFSFWK
jgi:hypothetical protein